MWILYKKSNEDSDKWIPCDSWDIKPSLESLSSSIYGKSFAGLDPKCICDLVQISNDSSVDGWRLIES